MISIEVEVFMNIGYLYLAIAIISEVIGSNMVVNTDGFTKLKPTLICIFCFGLAIYMLSLTVKHIPLYIAYAIWGGLGIILVTILGVIFWKQNINIATLIGILFIVVGVVIVNLFEKAH